MPLDPSGVRDALASRLATLCRGLGQVIVGADYVE